MVLTKGKSNLRVLSVVLACLVVGGALFGSGYWLGQRTLQPQLKTMAAQPVNPSRPPGNPWAGANAAHPMPFMPGANIPANATPEMKEFMQNRQMLLEKMTQLRQQNPSTNGAPDPKLFAQFQQENADLLKRQKELSQIVSEQQARNPIPTPPPLQLPPNASAQQKTYLIARDQLARDQIAFINQHRTDDPAARQVAMQQWRQQNVTRFQQLQQMAQAMAQTTPPNPPIPITPTSANK